MRGLRGRQVSLYPEAVSGREIRYLRHGQGLRASRDGYLEAWTGKIKRRRVSIRDHCRGGGEYGRDQQGKMSESHGHSFTLEYGGPGLPVLRPGPYSPTVALLSSGSGSGPRSLAKMIDTLHYVSKYRQGHGMVVTGLVLRSGTVVANLANGMNRPAAPQELFR